jgi:hypothetical protein
MIFENMWFYALLIRVFPEMLLGLSLSMIYRVVVLLTAPRHPPVAVKESSLHSHMALQEIVALNIP